MIEIIKKCNRCNNKFTAGNDAQGIPSGVGFALQDGKTIRLCKKCIMDLGRAKASGNDKAVQDFFKFLQK